MSMWRVVLTDSEGPSGVAPVCPSAEHPSDAADWVFDCCPGPHLECWSDRRAAAIAQALTEADAEVCS